jgi:hypothetical protein
LDANNYNDLIVRKNTCNNPLILILFILPENRNEWLNISNEELILRKCAYWYLPDEAAEITLNSSSKTIEINLGNLISIENFKSIFNKFG